MKPGKHQRPMSLLWFFPSHVIMTVYKENQHGDRGNVNVSSTNYATVPVKTNPLKQMFRVLRLLKAALLRTKAVRSV